MPASCGTCGRSCNDDDEVKCGCGKSFHLQCAQPKTRGAKKDWCCESCKPDKSVASSAGATTSAITKEFLLNTLEAFKTEMLNEFKTEMLNELKQYATETKELRESVQFLSDAVDKSNALMEDIKKKLAKTLDENMELRKENATLRGTVNHLEVRVRNLEQHSRKQNIEINGLPETGNEDVNRLLSDVAKAIGVEMKPEKVVAAHRVPSFNKKRTAPVIVRFSTYEERNAWIAGFKEVRPLTADKVNSSFDKSAKVFVNEHLSPENKLLLSKAKEVAKAKGYQYVWSRDGKIFIRKQAGERCRKIELLSDLDKL